MRGFLFAAGMRVSFLPCGHLDFESAASAQNDEFEGSFDSVFTLVKRQNLAKKLNKLCTRKMGLALKVILYLDSEVTSNSVSADQRK